MVNTLIEHLLWSLGILSVPPLTAAADAALTRSTEVPPDRRCALLWTRSTEVRPLEAGGVDAHRTPWAGVGLP